MTDSNLNILIEDVKAIVTERGYNARVEIIHEKWEVGERIATDAEYKKSSKGAGEIINEVSIALEMASSDIYDSIRFFEKFPESAESAMESLGKNVSWHNIREEHLGGEKSKKEKEPLYKLSKIENVFRIWIRHTNDVAIIGQELNPDEEWHNFKSRL